MGVTTQPVPPPRADDHVRGPHGAQAVVLYADFTCPRCALAHTRLAARDDVRVAFRHFALRSKHPRAQALGAAAEAAAAQGAFWAMADSLFADQGHVDDPHLWARVERLGLDLERFERDRRAPTAVDRVAAHTREGVRAGVVVTPAVYPPLDS